MQESNAVLRRRKRPDSGEDAFFVSKVASSSSNVAFAVADGVGGWTQSRIDPGDFSHGLCGYMASCALHWDRPIQELHAIDLLGMGYERVLEDEAIVAGGSTALVGVGLADGKVDLAKYLSSSRVCLSLLIHAVLQSRRLGLHPHALRNNPRILNRPNSLLQHPIPTKHSASADARPGRHFWRGLSRRPSE